MDETMSTTTKTEILVKMRRRYLTAGLEHKGKLIDEAVSLLGYHRKAAIRALNGSARASVSIATGRPREYESRELLPVLRKIWRAANYPCSRRLQAMLPEWVTGYEEYEKSVSASIKEPSCKPAPGLWTGCLRAQRRRPS